MDADAGGDEMTIDNDEQVKWGKLSKHHYLSFFFNAFYLSEL